MPVVEVPGMGDVEFPDDMNDEQIAAAIKKNLAPQPQTAQVKPPSFGAQLVSAAIRPIAKGVAALPLMAMDAGVGARNLLTKGNYELPSSMFNKSLNTYTLPPEGLMGKGAEFISSALVGSRIPGPQIKNPAPTNNFPLEPSVRDMTLLRSQAAGYKVPPSTTNPSGLNRALESIGGKIATAQDASLENQQVSNELAKRAVGLGEDALLSKESLEGIRKQAGQVYKEIADSGDIKPDQQFIEDLKSLQGASKKIADLMPQATAKVDYGKLGGMVQRGYEDIPAGQAMQNLKELRFESQRNLSPLAAQNPESGALGRAQKKAADALEALVMRHLNANGKEELANKFTDARTLIAKTHSVEKALNESTGNVIAQKLAGQLAKGKPLTGELRNIAQFSQAFPKAAQQIIDSGSVRNTDVILGAGTAALSREPSYLLYPFARQAIRSGLLSRGGQNLLSMPSTLQMPPGLLMGGLTAEEQARQGLFGQ